MIVIALVAWGMPCFADTAAKLRSGLKDVVSSPLIVSDNVKTETAKAKFMPFGLVGGFLKGSFYMAKQIVTGTFTIVTAPVDMLHK